MALVATLSYLINIFQKIRDDPSCCGPKIGYFPEAELEQL